MMRKIQNLNLAEGVFVLWRKRSSRNLPLSHSDLSVELPGRRRCPRWYWRARRQAVSQEEDEPFVFHRGHHCATLAYRISRGSWQASRAKRSLFVFRVHGLSSSGLIPPRVVVPMTTRRGGWDLD